MTPEEFGNCAVCGEGVMHEGIPIFYRVVLETHGINHQKAQRQHGLELMLGGNAAVAAAMGDRDISEKIDETTVTVCHSCSLGTWPLLRLQEPPHEQSDG